MNNITKILAKVFSFAFIIALVLVSHIALAGTLTNFSYSGTSYTTGATADYTFNYTLETADPNMIFYASWPAGFDLTSSTANVTVNGVPSSLNQEYWNGGGSGNTYIRLADPTAPAGAEISVTISNVINPSSGGSYTFGFFRTADGGGNGIDFPASLDPITISAPEIPFSGQGTGTVQDPYLIANCVQLQEVQNHLDANYLLAGDIDCSDTENWNGGKGFDPIGDVNNPFTGTFNGGGNEISNMYIDRADNEYGQGQDDETYVGIFAYALNATIQNIDVVNSKVKGYVYVGGIVGYEANSTLENLTFNVGTADNSCDPGHCVWARFGEYGGGIVGYMNGGTLTNATTAGPVKGSGIIIGGIVGHMENATLTNVTSSSNIDGGQTLGGILGEAFYSTITNAHASGNVLVVEEQNVGKQGATAGGLAGLIISSGVSNSDATGTVTGLSNIGGFSGYIINSQVTDSFATGEVNASSSPAGGFGGFTGCESVFTRVYATGNVNGNGYAGGFSGDDGCEGPGSTFNQVYATGNVVSNNDYAGGFLGRALGSTFNNVYSQGNVSGTNYVGGFLGYTNYSSLANVYSTGSVTGSGDSYKGGFIGQNESDGTTISNSFWDGDKAGINTTCGDESVCAGATKSTTSLMNTKSTFTDATWDFNTIWGINGSDNQGYPFFGYQGFVSAPVVTPPTSGGSGGAVPIAFLVSNTAPTSAVDTSGYKPTSCAPYLTSYIQFGSKNNSEDVKKLQTFLNTYEGAQLIVDGVYKQVDVDAVKVFQEKHRDVLSFWNLKKPTGYVYVATQKAINRIYCEKTKGFACPYFNTYLKKGDSNTEVLKVKMFLNNTQSENLSLSSTTYDDETTSAVKRFQVKYKSKILTPWGIAQPSGRWYQSTKKAADEVLGCFAPVRLDNGKVLE